MTKTKKIIVYFVVVFMLVVSFSQTPNFQNSSERSKQPDSYVLDYLYNSPLYNRSNYINFTGPPIVYYDSPGFTLYYRIIIDDDDPAYTWNKTAAENEWCSGSGTWNDPYVIENLYMDVNGVGGGIIIRNSNKHFVIQNNWIINTVDEEWGEAVVIEYTSNGTVKDNVFRYCEYGAKIRHNSYNITVSNNIMIHNSSIGSRGIELTNVYNSTIIDNKMSNLYGGMGLFYSDNINIRGNYIENIIKNFSQSASVVYLRDCNNFSIVRNVIADLSVTGNHTVQQIDSGMNVVEYNSVSTNQSLLFDFDISFSGADDSLYQSQTQSSRITLVRSYNNYIAYNILLLVSPDEDDNGTGSEAIPGFNPILILGVIFIVSLVILKKRVRK